MFNLTFERMYRIDRVKEDVNRKGRRQVNIDLFDGKGDSYVDGLYRKDANPTASRIEMICRYFGRPASYYLDLSEGDGSVVYAAEDIGYNHQAAMELKLAKEKEALYEQTIASKDELIRVLRDEMNHYRELYESLRNK